MGRFTLIPSFLRRRGSPAGGHASAEQLVMFADGELRDDESAACAAHIASCWTCRARLDEMADTIASIVAYRDRSLDGCALAPPSGRARFLAALSRLAEAERRTTSIPATTWLTAWPRLKVAGVGAVLALVVAGALAIWHSSEARVSASEVLRQADERVARLVKPGTVFYRRWKSTVVRADAADAGRQTDYVIEEWAEGSPPNRLMARVSTPDGRLLVANWVASERGERRVHHFDAVLSGTVDPPPGSAAPVTPTLFLWPTRGEVRNEISRYPELQRRALQFSYDFEGVDVMVMERAFRAQVDERASRAVATPVTLADGTSGVRLDVTMPQAIIRGFEGTRFTSRAGAWSGSYFYDSPGYALVRVEGEWLTGTGRRRVGWAVDTTRLIPAASAGDVFTFTPPPGTPTVTLSAADVVREYHRVLFGTGQRPASVPGRSR